MEIEKWLLFFPLITDDRTDGRRLFSSSFVSHRLLFNALHDDDDEISAIIIVPDCYLLSFFLLVGGDALICLLLTHLKEKRCSVWPAASRTN